jgi:Domain of unknown function (DUF1830)
MAQILDPVPNGLKSSMLCCYVNTTSQIQIARISNISNWYFERVVFPGQRLIFEALPEALLEVHTGMMASAILSDTIPCTRLWIQEGSKFEVNSTKEIISENIDKKQSIEISDKKSQKTVASLKPVLSIR